MNTSQDTPLSTSWLLLNDNRCYVIVELHANSVIWMFKPYNDGNPWDRLQRQTTPLCNSTWNNLCQRTLLRNRTIKHPNVVHILRSTFAEWAIPLSNALTRPTAVFDDQGGTHCSAVVSIDIQTPQWNSVYLLGRRKLLGELMHLKCYSATYTSLQYALIVLGFENYWVLMSNSASLEWTAANNNEYDATLLEFNLICAWNAKCCAKERVN